ncbi:MAG TPA: phosphopantothenoylcysteine decarboxylase, partial [Microbacterium sp.]|nr:phosphopantothenoylcysteine decarboxylase [Microbacterium sp.]
VADYRPAETAERKLTKEAGTLTRIDLVENEDIVAGLAAGRRAGQLVVAFAAETPQNEQEMLDRARRKRERKGVDLLVVNEVGWEQGFEAADNTVQIISADGVVGAASGTKLRVADAVWNAVVAAR